LLSATTDWSSTIRAAHGILSVPVPAVLKLWEMRGTPVYSNGIDQELVTPTGAAIATTLSTDWFPTSNDSPARGTGAGSRDLPIPNILRLWLGESRGEGRIRITHTKPISGTISVLRNANR